MKKFNVVKCPKCGYEYLPDEIFYPNSLLGKTKNVIRDENGKIIYFDGDSMDTHEEYCCDKCNCTFDIDLKSVIETKININHDFSEDYTATIYEDRIQLKEPVEEEKGLW